MIASLRKFGAVGVIWYMTSTAMGMPTIDTSSSNYSGWNERSTLPSATASAAFMNDSDVQLASDDQAANPTAKDDSNCTSCQGSSNSCGCGDINYCCCPPWYVDAGVVILHRNRQGSDPIMRPTTVGAAPIIGGHDDPFGWNGDLDITVGYRTDCCNAWEVRYFGDPGADANAGIDFLVRFGSPESYTIATGGPFLVVGLNVDYQTDLHSIEINQRHTVNDFVTFLSGFRYLEVDEDLTFDLSIFGSQIAQYAWHDNNHLYGGQVGADVNLFGNGSPLKFDSIFKGGLYGVEADNSYVNRTILNTTVRGGAAESDVAFVGEIDLVGTYRICNNVALRGGYQLLWIDGVALAADSASNTNPVNGGNIIDTDGQLFYHGAIAALEFAW